MTPAEAVSADIYEDLHLYVNFQTGATELDGKPLKLANKEFELFVYILRHARELVSRETLLMTIWGYGPEVRTRTLDVHIRRLRQSLEPYGKVYIETVFSLGYRFQPYTRKRAEPTQLVALEAPRTTA
jgi:DNA-binding response OmpR family regulator